MNSENTLQTSGARTLSNRPYLLPPRSRPRLPANSRRCEPTPSRPRTDLQYTLYHIKNLDSASQLLGNRAANTPQLEAQSREGLPADPFTAAAGVPSKLSRGRESSSVTEEGVPGARSAGWPGSSRFRPAPLEAASPSLHLVSLASSQNRRRRSTEYCSVG